jgi:hypothetical protein
MKMRLFKRVLGLPQVKCLKFKVPKVPKVKGRKVIITCFGPVFIGLKMGFPARILDF